MLIGKDKADFGDVGKDLEVRSPRAPNVAQHRPTISCHGAMETGVGGARGIPPRLEKPMSKGQKSNREARKPKKEKVKTNASNPSTKPGAIKGLENMKNG